MEDDHKRKATESLVASMKLAVAMAIIRSKPESLSGLQHAENLCRNYQVSSDQWRERAVKLEEEMITLKQQLVLAKLQTQQEATNSDGTAGDEEPSCSQPMFLTPPCSSEEQKARQEKHQTSLEEHNTFFRSFLSLKLNSHSQSTESQQILLDSVANAVKTMQYNLVQRPGSVSQTVVFHTIEHMCGMCDSAATTGEIGKQMIQCVLGFAKFLVDVIFKLDELDKSETQEYLSSLLVHLSRSNSLRPLILDLLQQHIQNFSNHLRLVKHGNNTLNTAGYENIYYILSVCEQVLEVELRWTSGQKVCVPRDSLGCIHKCAEESLLHITADFPLFAQFVWRIDGLADMLMSQTLL